MRLFFDSSVLVAVFYANHEHHSASKKAFLAAGTGDFCARRSLGEVYTTLTGFPLRPRITGPQGIAMVHEIREKLTLVSLSESEYISALQEAALQAVVGNTAYDALIARCAVKAQAAALLTWNVKHFMRLGADVARIVKTPAEI